MAKKRGNYTTPTPNAKPVADPVALITDPYGFATLSVQDAQMNDDFITEPLDLDSDEESDAAPDTATLDETLTETLDDELPQVILEPALDSLESRLEGRSEENDFGSQPMDHAALARLEKSVAEAAENDARELAAAMAKAASEALAAGGEVELTEAQELARQIAEDQALQKETDRLNAEAEADAAREPLPAGLTGENPDLDEVQAACETLLFMSDKPLSAKKIQDFLGDAVSLSAIQEALTILSRRTLSPAHGVELVQVAGGWQFRTKPSQSAVAKRLSKIQFQRLSRGAMESLAIIAYKQPILKDEIDKIRGVDSSYFLRLLMDRNLIQIDGRSDLPGRPILYSTGDEFLKVFGLKDLQAMPPLAEIESMIPSSEVGRGDDNDPNIIKMRNLVSEMNLDPEGALHYNPREDETLIAEIKERVGAIATSTPTLDEQKAAEKASKSAAESDKLL